MRLRTTLHNGIRLAVSRQIADEGRRPDDGEGLIRGFLALDLEIRGVVAGSGLALGDPDGEADDAGDEDQRQGEDDADDDLGSGAGGGGGGAHGCWVVSRPATCCCGVRSLELSPGKLLQTKGGWLGWVLFD